MIIENSDRTRRSRGSLTAAEILDAAETVMAGGNTLITIRAVAKELRSSPMALYQYFPTKDDLVDALLDRVLGRLKRPAETNDWLRDFTNFAAAHHDVLLNHPWAVLPLFSHPNPGANTARVTELAFEILARGGVVGEDAVVAFYGVLALNYGSAAFVSARQEVAAKDRVSEMEAVLANLSVVDFPHTVAMAREMARYGDQDQYDRGLEQLMLGVRASHDS